MQSRHMIPMPAIPSKVTPPSEKKVDLVEAMTKDLQDMIQEAGIPKEQLKQNAKTVQRLMSVHRHHRYAQGSGGGMEESKGRVEDKVDRKDQFGRSEVTGEPHESSRPQSSSSGLSSKGGGKRGSSMVSRHSVMQHRRKSSRASLHFGSALSGDREEWAGSGEDIRNGHPSMPPLPPLPPLPSLTLETQSSTEIRDLLNRYSIELDDAPTTTGGIQDNYGHLSLVAQGDNGCVYSASLLKDTVTRGETIHAIKVIPLQCTSKLEILGNELAMMKQSHSHPNIVQCIGGYLVERSPYVLGEREEEEEEGEGREEGEEMEAKVQEGPCIWMVMEWMDFGALTDLLPQADDPSSHYLTERHMAKVTLEVLKAIMWLHSRRMIHRDIKSDNILLTSQGDVKLGKNIMGAWELEDQWEREREEEKSVEP